ncbi:MAG: MATE family efflux transporter [Hespellia sp.]|nr:MATE family efflux transporter [Hespellia sp.]
MSRMTNTIRNTAIGFAAQFVVILLNFINRTIFIQYLGAEYLGLSGLFSNILSMLSLAELGIGVAISFSLYKPLGENDLRKTKALMNFYQLAYRIIGVVILILGLCLIPFLDYLIKDKPDISHFSLIYVLFLVNTVVSYFFTYKRSLLSADQKEYINSVNRTIFAVVQCIGQFLVLLLTRNYLLYLTVVIICTLGSNIRISYQCDKMYPYLRNNQEKLTKEETKSLLKYVAAQMSHKVGGIVVSGTDNILTTSLVSGGLVIVGVYSNYLLLINTIRSVITMFFTSVTASIGNLNAESNAEKSKEVFNKMFFLNMCFYGITANCIFNLANDFIRLWLSDDYLLSTGVVIIISINYYISGMRQTCQTYNTTLGLFWNDRFKPWIEAVINLVFSIALIHYFGFMGVLFGTLISTVATSFWVEPYILYKHGFKMKLIDYFIRYGQYTAITLLATILAFYFTKILEVGSFFMWIVKAAIVGGTSLGMVALCFRSKPEFIELKIIAKDILRKFVRSENNGK